MPRKRSGTNRQVGSPEAGANDVPSAPDGPATPGKLPSRWRRTVGLAALVGTLAVALVSAALSKEGMTVLSKAGRTMVAAACSVLGCAELTGRVRPQDKDWLDQCPAHKREVWRTTLEPPQWGYGDFLEKSPDVVRYRYGAELRSGPVVVTVTAPGITMMRPRLYGDIRTGSDGASLRFNKMTLIDGREFEICAIAAVGPVDEWGPGFPIMPAQEIHRMPDSELHPKDGFVYVVFGAPFNVYFAK